MIESIPIKDHGRERDYMPGYYYMNSLKLIQQMKNEFFLSNYEGQNLWFDIDEFKAKYDVVESDFIGKSPLM